MADPFITGPRQAYLASVASSAANITVDGVPVASLDIDSDLLAPTNPGAVFVVNDSGSAAWIDGIPLNTQTADYTLALTDSAKTVEMNSGSATVLTVPPNSSVAFAVGTVIEVCRLGAGSVTITPGSGVTIPNRVQAAGTSSRTISNQYSSASLRKRATNVWVLVGDIA